MACVTTLIPRAKGNTSIDTSKGKGGVSLHDSTNIEISLAIEKKCLKEVKGGYGIGRELVAWAQGGRFGRDALEMEHNIKGSAKVIS